MMMRNNLSRKVIAISIVASLSLIMVIATPMRSVFAATTYTNNNNHKGSFANTATTPNNQNKAGASNTQNKNRFASTLTGKNEVPPNPSKATGSATFIGSGMGKILKYKVSVMNIDKVTQAHIHSGRVGQNGPIVVTLFKSQTPTGLKNGILSQGSITSANLEGPLKGKQISDLITLIKNGGAYVNVHTQMNPNGEIRGQISK